MALSTNEFARRDGGAIEMSPDPVRLTWALSGVTTKDAHTLSGRFTVSAQLADNPTDRKMFAEVMLGARSVLTINDLTEHFAESIRNASTQLAAKRTVEM